MALSPEQKRRKKVSVELNKLPLKTLEDYKKYNEKARSLGMPVKPAPEEFHEKMTVQFLRKDSFTHPVPLKFRNAEIDFHKKVTHGKIYDIPVIVIRAYQKLGVPHYRQVVNTMPNASTVSETVLSHIEPRFAFQVVV